MPTSKQRAPLTYRSFPVTDWAAVRNASHPSTALRLPWLDALLQEYLPILKRFFRRRFRLDEATAEDLVQSFALQKIMRQKLLAEADPLRGRFRSFLVNSATHFVISEFRKQQAGKRAPDRSVSWLGAVAEKDLADLAYESARELDQGFARVVFAEAVERMQSECAQSGRTDLWTIFEGRLLNPVASGVPALTNERLAANLGLVSPGLVSNLLVTAKRMFGRNFRAIVAQYVSEDAALEAEIRALKDILAESGVESM